MYFIDGAVKLAIIGTLSGGDTVEMINSSPGGYIVSGRVTVTL